MSLEIGQNYIYMCFKANKKYALSASLFFKWNHYLISGDIESIPKGEE